MAPNLTNSTAQLILFNFICALLWYVLDLEGPREAPGAFGAPGARAKQILKTRLRLHNRASGPEIVDLGGLKAAFLPRNPWEKMGGEAPHLFRWALR